MSMMAPPHRPRLRSRFPARLARFVRLARLARFVRLARVIALQGAVVLMVFAVAAPSSAVPIELFKCRYSGRVMQACCCRAKAQAEPRALPTSAPEVKPAACCELLRQQALPAVPASRDLEPGLLLAAPISTLALVLVPAPTHVSMPGERVEVQARAGPAIFLRDCRLLT